MACPKEQWTEDLLDALYEHYPKPLRRITEELQLEVAANPTAKHFGALLVAALIDAVGAGAASSLRDRAIPVKTIRMPRDDRPFESMSFPAFHPEEVARQEWEGSTLREQLGCLLLVTLYAKDRDVSFPDCTIGHAFFWSPEADEEARIRRDWTMFRDLFRQGQAEWLPTESQTKALHVRPHARDAPDQDAGGGVKRSFWLNRDFVLEVVQRNR